MILLSAALLQQFAQARQPNQDDPIRLRGELVVLDAQVLHKKTALAVDNLVREDFIVYEDGVKQHISHFSRDKLPLSVVILFDVSGSVAANRNSAQRLLKGAYEALNLLKPEDEVALMQFAEKATLIQSFTRDRDLVVNSLARMDGRGQYGTHVDEGILRAAKYMRSASNPDTRRVIIAVTDDVTVAIANRAYTVPTTHEEGEALRELYESGSVVCALVYDSRDNPVPPQERYHTTEPVLSDPSGNPGTPQIKLGVAKHFAETTGGISIKTSQEDIPTRLTEMIERLRQRYTIGYSPSNTARDTKFRKIKLSVTPDVERREGSVAVITRKGYYAK
jgi:VWFA-related protein